MNSFECDSSKCEEKEKMTATTVDEERCGFIQKLKRPDYRIKLIATLQIAIAFGVTGWTTGLKGPCLLDYLLITNTSLEKGSRYFTAASIGYAVGSLFGGIALDRYNRNLIFFTSLLTCAVSVTVIPWCVSYWAMLSCHFILGTTNGVIETGCNAECIRIWGKKAGPFLQFIVFAFAFGSILSPLAAKPYLASSLEANTSLVVSQNGYDVNKSEMFTNVSYSNESQVNILQPVSRIYIVLSITGALYALIAVSFLVTYCRNSGQIESHQTNTHHKSKSEDALSVCDKQTSLVLLGLLLLFYCALEETSGSFLVAFVAMRLGWTKVKGSVLTSVFFACIATGRFSGIFISNFCKSCKLIMISLICALACFIALYFGTVNTNEIVIWFCVGLSGVSMSYVYSAVFSWSEEDVIRVTAKISAYFVIMSSAGSGLSPVVTGLLMQESGPMYFIFISMASAVTCILLCTSLWLFVKYKFQKYKRNTILEVVVEGPKVTMLDN